MPRITCRLFPIDFFVIFKLKHDFSNAKTRVPNHTPLPPLSCSFNMTLATIVLFYASFHPWPFMKTKFCRTSQECRCTAKTTGHNKNPDPIGSNQNSGCERFLWDKGGHQTLLKFEDHQNYPTYCPTNSRHYRAKSVSKKCPNHSSLIKNCILKLPNGLPY